MCYVSEGFLVNSFDSFISTCFLKYKKLPRSSFLIIILVCCVLPFMMDLGSEVDNLAMDSLNFLHFRRNCAQPVLDFIAMAWNKFTFDAEIEIQ